MDMVGLGRVDLNASAQSDGAAEADEGPGQERLSWEAREDGECGGLALSLGGYFPEKFHRASQLMRPPTMTGKRTAETLSCKPAAPLTLGFQGPGALNAEARDDDEVRRRAGDAAPETSKDGDRASGGYPREEAQPAAREDPEGASTRRSPRETSAADVIRTIAVPWGNKSLWEADPEIWGLMELEKQRQLKGIELIASENFVSQAIMEALGSPLCNKYSEGQPGARYYVGNQHIDAIENLCRERALKAFDLDPEEWGVNVQPYSCTSANLAVFAGILDPPKDRIMGMDLASGGHMSHGYYTPSGKRVAAASVFFDTIPYKVDPTTGLIDYEKMEEKAMEYRPKLIVCGASSYPRVWDFARCRQIADKCGAILMCDMAHISGLVAAKEHPSPFEYVDIVTSTTHKTLSGPRGGIIFYRKGPIVNPFNRGTFNGARASSPGPFGPAVYDYEDRINFAVFPMMQGGPHDNHTAALAVAMKQVGSPEYAAYMRQVKKNAAALAAALVKCGCTLVTGGTDSHLMLWDLRPLGLTGQRLEKVCELCNISLNKSSVYGDSTSPPAGVRIGTPALTTRGCKESDMELVADFLVRAAQIAQKAALADSQQRGGHPSPKEQRSAPQTVKEALALLGKSGSSDLQPSGPNPGTPRAHKRPRLAEWMDRLSRSEEVKELRLAVHQFAERLDIPGFKLGIQVKAEEST